MSKDLVRTVYIVDVSDYDFSNHPGWGADIDASTMVCESTIPAWAGEILGVERHYINDRGRRSIERSRPSEEAQERHRRNQKEARTGEETREEDTGEQDDDGGEGGVA